MNELKEYLVLHPHINVVYFDVHNNWFLQGGRTIVSEKTRAEILGKEEHKKKK